jgi:receptor expression-enhancing protein 5/6
MSAQSQQVKQNFLNHPYVQQASQVANSQLNVLDKEVSFLRGCTVARWRH